MLRSFLFVFCALSLGAQSPPEGLESAPPPVEQALRARVNQFFQAYIDGKWRVAEQLVAEDSIDAFLGADKQRLQSFEIVKTHYFDNFSRAEIVVLTRREWLIQGRRMVVPMPVTTFWKVVDGQWYWYTPPQSATRNSPFGVMAPGPADSKATTRVLPADPTAAAASILDQVKIDKTEVRLSSYEPSGDEVTVTNAMPGKVTLRADTDLGVPGFILKLEKTELNAGEKCKLLLNMDPKDRRPKPTVTVRLWVAPLEKMIPIRVTFAIPPELERQLPKQP